ncbi:MAG: DsrE family protein, partial [Candidatus Hydrothermarchaeaceae archaeon]
AILHAVGCYTVIDEEVEPVVCFVGKGVLNCVTKQEVERFYGMESNGGEIKKLLMSDANVLACEEDVKKFGIEERLVDARDFDVDTEIKVVPFADIRGELEGCDHVMVF